VKLRHAAALILSGWYLMIPPSMSETSWACGSGLVAILSHKLFGTGDAQICLEEAKIANMNAPLYEWHDVRPFESLQDCEQAQEKLTADAKPASPELGARCIATDDPRLAK
jgi:hypothetical protein